jgi:hypothetical protein
VTPPSTPDYLRNDKPPSTQWAQIRAFFTKQPGITVAVVFVIVLACSFLTGRVTAPSDEAAPAVTYTVTTPVPVPVNNNNAGNGGGGTSTTQTQSTGSSTGTETGTNLASLTPVQSTSVGSYTTGPESFGTTTYPSSVRFQCYYTGGSIVYNVAGARFLNATLGIPNDSTTGAGNVMTVTFFKDSITPTSQLAPPYTVVLDKPQTVHLDMQNASQLVIQCAGHSQASHGGVTMDMSLGSATVTSS